MADEIQIVKKRVRVGDEDGDQITLNAEHDSFIKRRKSYDAVISDLQLLIEEEDEGEEGSDTETKLSAAAAASGEDDVSDSVLIRHLLEASDDELGLPTKLGEQEMEMCVSNYNCGGGAAAVFELEEEEGGVAMEVGLMMNGVGGGHFWEIEDEAANYYSLMQAQLFM